MKKRTAIYSLIEAKIEEWKTLTDDELIREYNKEKNFDNISNMSLIKSIMDGRGINSFEN